jgi:prolyl 4-hydroxylase
MYAELTLCNTISSGGLARHTTVTLLCDRLRTMSVVVNLSAELKTWIVRNLDRGCAAEQLIQSMIGQKFDPIVARGLIEAFGRARSTGTSITADALTLDVELPSNSWEAPRLPGGNAIHTADRSVRVLFRLRRPAIAVLADVLNADECEELIALAKPRLKPSTVVDPKTGLNHVVAHRNSDGMFFKLEETPFIAALDRRLSQLMNMPVSHGEGLQVLRYGPGTQSTPHFDFLTPSNPANQQSLTRSGQRVSSLVVYLNEVASGGETDFPEIGLAVCPQPGNAVYFEYCNSRNELDPLSLHAGAPVIVGDKWAVTKWMRQRPFVSA